MVLRKQLACSFCGKSAAEVSKLAAGPKVYICDACVAAASRIIHDSDGSAAATLLRAPTLRQRIIGWLSRARSLGHRSRRALLAQ